VPGVSGADDRLQIRCRRPAERLSGGPRIRDQARGIAEPPGFEEMRHWISDALEAAQDLSD